MRAAIFSPAIGVGQPGRVTWSVARRPSSSRGVKSGTVGPQQQWKAVRLLGRVVAGREPGRTDDKQIIAFMNQGEGMQFAAVGRKLYDLARERGLGVNAPLEWFHQDKKYIP